ncbi:hypothetical protein P1A145kb_p127 [Pectobacterium phage DU_PP_I]|nr:hypothetical protein P1A145kb_p127 [Pectobacterium phage DU_PP_I]ATS93844.1 hypothetical protein P12B145kb_p128 [Pectobacterium phage DU_PP_IV]
MICYDKYGKMTPEFQAYQQEAWDKLRAIAGQLTKQAIASGVCPNAMRDTMTKAIECGCVVASAEVFVEDNKKEVPHRGSPDWHMGLVKGL